MRGLVSAERCDEIKQEVIFMFEECGVDSYPIDPFFIARKLHYILRPYSSLSLDDYWEACSESPDAFSRPEFNHNTNMWEYVIYYNDEQLSQGRIRWTILHEIGHCYLGHHDNPDDSLYPIEEQEANFFAKYSIAPPPLIHICRCASPADIERIFLTSATAADYCFSYYQKWWNFGPPEFLDFEIQLLRLFHIAA